jgi:death-on-curing protein
MYDDIQFLTKEHIYLIHENAIQTFGGTDGVYDITDGRIESILSQQFPIFDYEKYPSVFQKAAMLLYLFTKGHCFVDGNKRVGIQSAIVFMSLNGYEDSLEDEEGYNKTMEVSISQISEDLRDDYIDSLANWLSYKFISIE